MSFKVFPLLALTAILFSRAKPLQQFGRWSRREYFSEIILKSGHWHSKSCRFKFIFLFLPLVVILFINAKVFH